MSLKQRVPFLRWSFWRLAIGARNIAKTGQIGDGREAAAADYVVANARQGDIADVIAKVDEFAYEKSILINVGDEKGELLDAAVRRANPGLALELGTYCGYGSLRITRAAPSAKVVSVELSAANAEVARRIWAHAGVDDRVADNILIPGSPKYREFIASSRASSSTRSNTRPTASIRRWFPMSCWSRST